MIKAFKDWFYRCRCSIDISQQERESIFALEILRDEENTRLRDELREARQNIVILESIGKEYVQEILEKQEQIQVLTSSLDDKYEQIKEFIAAHDELKEHYKTQSVSNVVNLRQKKNKHKNRQVIGHVPECMD